MKYINYFLAISILLFTYNAGAQTSFISENFSGGSGATPPTGWTQNIISGVSSDTWRFNNPGSRSTASPIAGQFAIFDSDNYSSGGGSENVALESPSFNTTGSSTILLDFDHQFRHGWGGIIYVEVWNGSSWNQVFSINGGSGSSTVTTVGSESIDISTYAGNKTGVKVRFRWTGSYSWWWIVDNVEVYAPPACSGTPNPGNTIAGKNPICNTGGSTTLSLQNAITGTGVSYQWQSSTNGSTYSNISGATSSTYTASPTNSTYYRCNVTCSNSSQTGTSTPLLLNTSFMACYCIPDYSNSCSFGDYLSNVQIGTLNNNSGCSSNEYADYTSTVSATSLNIGSNYSTSTTSQYNDHYVSAWIDYNHNGVFENSEYKYLGYAANGGVPLSSSITIPATAMAGNTVMRVRTRWLSTATDPCATTYSYGEAEDYLVNLVCPNVSISAQPSNAGICPGANTSFSATGSTTGGVALTYQWEVNTGSGWTTVSNGGVYSNATTGTLNITGAPATMNGYQYRSVVTSNCGEAATSNAGTLTILALPAVTAHPVNDTTCQPGNASFSINATGAGLTYQWEVNTGSGWATVTNGGVYSNATTSTLNITSATAGMNDYLYRCKVTGTCTPSASSNTAKLTVNGSNSVTITTHPVNTTVCTGTPGTMTVMADPSGLNISYQWQVNTGSGFGNISNGSTYAGTATSTLTFSNPALSMNGYIYRCLVTDECGNVFTSNQATLTVNTSPTISLQPSNQAICPGGTAVFASSASGSSTINYQWQYNAGTGWVNLSNYGPYSGAFTNTLTVTNPSKYYTGFQYRCELNTGCTPSATTNSATLTVNSQPNIILSPSSVFACPAGSTSFSVNASGTGITYQWQINTGSGWSNLSNGSVYSNTNSATLGLSNITTGMNGYQYRCVISGTCTPQQITSAALLTVGTTTVINSQPSSQTVCGGATTNFSVSASGTNLTYQWQYLNGNSWTDVPHTFTGFSGAETNTLTIVTNNPNDISTRTLRCVVGGSCGTQISSTVVLTVYGKPAISTNPPSAHTICETSNYIVSVNATGHNLNYNWQVNTGSGWSSLTNGTNYSGVSNNNLNILNAPTSFSGYQYRCNITGTCTPSVTTSPLTLTVLPLITPTATVVASDTDICAGTNVTFNVTTTGGGNSPSYQWQINGNNVGSNSTSFSSSSLSDNDHVKCLLTSSYACPYPATVASNYKVINVTQYSTPTISIASSSGNVECSGVPVTFKANTTNGGTKPTYDWRLNNVSVGSNMDNYVTTSLQSGDQVKCIFTSGLKCPSPKTLTSNTITMTINQTTKSSIVIAPNPDSVICNGKTVTLYTFFNNGGTLPQFQWMINGNDIPGATQATYLTKNIADGDVIQCRLISSNLCVFPEESLPISFDVIQNVTPKVGIIVYPNGPDAFNFQANPTNGGATPSYNWYINGVMQSEHGSLFTATGVGIKDKVHADMTSSLECVTQKTVSSKTITTGIGEISEVFTELTLYPNPNTGKFTITGKLEQAITNEDVMVRISNSVGQTVYSQSYPVSGSELKLPITVEDNLTNGLYMVNIIIDGKITSLRFMLNR